MAPNESRHPPARTALPFAGLALCLLALMLVDVRDLDHGFHVAQGNHILRHGLPERQILVPLLAHEAWTSVYALGSVAIALAWKAGGPAGLVLLKLLGYGGAFMLAAAAAAKRGAPAWLACLLAAACACTMQLRFVERPTLFSALFLGAVALAFANRETTDRFLAKPAIAIPCLGLASTLWAFTHAGWNIGLLATLLLAFAATRNVRARVCVVAGAVAVPLVLVPLVHPAGVRALLGPISFVGGEGAKFGVAEHQLSSWRAMPFAIPVWIAGVAAAVALLRRRRLFESALLAIVAAGTVVFPRFVLPLAILAIPFAGELLSRRSRFGSRTPPLRTVALVSVLLPLAGIATTSLVPWRTWGLGIDPALDTRGVAKIVGFADPRDGPVLASFGWSSLLLSNESVARQGVVMDGRLEEYSRQYYEDTYLPALAPDGDWPAAVARTGAAFYCEAWQRSPADLDIGSEFVRRLGWRLVAWDDSSRLFARPDIVEAYRLDALAYDPQDLDRVLAGDPDLAGIASELRRQTDQLEERGYPSARGRIALARIDAALGDIGSAEDSLAAAERSGGRRFASWWAVMAACAIERGDRELARLCAKRIRNLGNGELATRIEAAAGI